jgi:hypothetical protein
LEKQHRPIISIDDGGIKELNPLPEDVSASICFNSETDSNVTETSDVHSEKQHS